MIFSQLAPGPTIRSMTLRPRMSSLNGRLRPRSERLQPQRLLYRGNRRQLSPLLLRLASRTGFVSCLPLGFNARLALR